MKTFSNDMGEPSGVEPEPIVGADRRQVVDFIDAWLADSAWTVDSRAIDFALDVRNMLIELENALPEPVGAAV